MKKFLVVVILAAVVWTIGPDQIAGTITGIIQLVPNTLEQGLQQK